MKTAFVTGGSGFIGSWLVQELLDNNYKVSVIARNRNRLLPDIRNNCKIIEKSLQQLKPDDIIPSPDLFFHLAWMGVSSDFKNNLRIQMENISCTLHALEVANKAGCGTFLATGTVAEYALCDNVMDMASRQTPNDIYGAAKVSAYYFLEVRARQLGQPFIWSVVPSTFGERRTDDNIITYTIKSLLNGEKPIYGSLKQMWDFLYVRDVVRAIRLIGEKGTQNKVYGIGSGEYKTLYAYITTIRDIIDPCLPLGIGENQEQSKRTFGSCVNNYDLKKDTGFQPKYTFDEGIGRTIQYFRKYLE